MFVCISFLMIMGLYPKRAIVHMSRRIILRQGSRILLPSEYVMLRSELPLNYQVLCDALLNTGMRVVEFWPLCDHPEWYHSSARIIDLPKEGSAKKGNMEERTIRLTARGAKSLDILFETKPDFRERDSMRGALIRASERSGLGSKGIMPKMFRKWLASYFVECRKDLDIDTLEICANMGHDEKTLRKYYYGVFNPGDHAEIYEFMRGINK